jgi:hypothetical protein
MVEVGRVVGLTSTALGLKPLQSPTIAAKRKPGGGFDGGKIGLGQPILLK